MAMEQTKQYACGGNLAWLKVTYSTSPGVPYNERAVQKLKDFYFGGKVAPLRYPENLIIAVSSDQVKEGNMMTQRGAMESVSPPELPLNSITRIRLVYLNCVCV